MSKKKFDSKGNLIYYRRGGKKSVWKYDEKNRLIYSKEHGRRIQVWKYDENDNLVLEKSGKQVTVSKYNEENRLIYWASYYGSLSSYRAKEEWYKYEGEGLKCRTKITEKEFLELEYSTKPIDPKDIKKKKLFYGSDHMVAFIMVVIFIVAVAGLNIINVYTMPQRQAKSKEKAHTFIEYDFHDYKDCPKQYHPEWICPQKHDYKK